MNGMTSAPVGRQGTKTLHTSDDQGVTSSHVVPVERFIHYIDKNGTCLCGPLVDYVEVGGRIVTSVIHYALAAEYYDGGWGSGPEDPDLEPVGPDPTGGNTHRSL
jgi:hypothetical protein